MKAKITLAEAATTHPDGTVSMLRAGITRVWARELPIRFSASLVIRIESEPAERGKNDIEVQCIDEDGNDRLPTIKAQMDGPKGGGDATIVMGLQQNFTNYGLYQFNVLGNRILLDSWDLKVLQPEQHEEKGGDEDNDTETA